MYRIPASKHSQDARASRQHFVGDGLMGTDVAITVDGAPSSASDLASAIFDEIRRLESVFNWFDPGSELRRWSRNESSAGPELAEVAALAQLWKSRTGGAFDPAVGALVALWTHAAKRGRVPSQSEIAETLSSLTNSVAHHNLNGIAKGWIVDRAVEIALAKGAPWSLIVNAGGDVLHIGGDPILVGVEDPKRPYDNGSPLRQVAVDNGALATSGSSRRAWVIDGVRYSHVIDPRTGWPQRRIASASVIAPDVATADAIATALTVVEIDEGLTLSNSLRIACCIIDEAGVMHRNAMWHHAEQVAAVSGLRSLAAQIHPESNKVMDDRSGESRYEAVSRRAFLRRSAALSLTVAIPGTLLAACGTDDAATFENDLGDSLIPTVTTSETGATTTSTTTPTTTNQSPVPGTTLPTGAEFVVDFNYTAQGSGGSVENPYVAVWVEDREGELVATVALWFLQSEKGLKWLSDLRRWSTVDGSDAAISAISSATRPPGQYSVIWDGTDTDGSLVPQGEYYIAIESAREKGPYSLIREPITLGAEPFTQAIEPEGELTDAAVSLIIA